MRARIGEYLGDLLVIVACLGFQIFLLILAGTDWLAELVEGLRK